MPREGQVLVISGVDGAGKSTVVDNLLSMLEATRRVERVSAGKPQGGRLEALRSWLRNSDGGGTNGGDRRPRHRARILRDALPSLVLALLRLKVSRRARALARSGVTVVSDRWPTLEHGKMDGPKIATDLPGLTGAVLRVLAGWEMAIYRRMEPADIAFYLIVDEQVAIQRNAERVKAGKESTEDIVRRYRENIDFHPIAHRVERIGNNGTLQEVLTTLEGRLGGL
ncbi:hypothetical protein CR158_17875 [Halomonas heilongjiangensis]|uniref:Thymidylate kinase n=1 Tax=Halomonas heilongjiangensis TaxID=1387883 RepID=A0A2N7TUJ6_9GAMM|nr:hypothetical protein C1H66_01080 [Halomonas heilongjiangensis]PXX87672.1 hypothetical protein CR158_17875 [Halomonas heilongjiangensis]